MKILKIFVRSNMVASEQMNLKLVKQKRDVVVLSLCSVLTFKLQWQTETKKEYRLLRWQNDMT